MSVQINHMNVIISHTRQNDGSYKTVQKIEAVCSDPAGANPTSKGTRSVSGIVQPDYVGTDTLDAAVATALAAVKTASGAA